MARIIEGVREVKTLLYTHNADVGPGDVIVVNGVVLIAINAALADTVNVWAFSCRAVFDLADNEAVGACTKVFYNTGTELATAVAAGATFVGVSIEPAAEADEELVVDMFPAPELPAAGIATANIADGAVTEPKVADGAVTLAKLAAAAAQHLPAVIADPGDTEAIPVTVSGTCALTTAAAETRALAAPTFVGQRLTICLDVDGGDCVLTADPVLNQAGNNTATFANAGEFLSLEAIVVADALVWRVAASDIAAALATV